jgi:NAD(P)-dependent dehydrogenase (short-subunit alcohol dehydrogenase family)
MNMETGVQTPRALSGKHAVVTGGGSGIGAEIAAQLLRQGAAVTIVGRSAARLKQTVAALASLGEIDYAKADVAHGDSVEQAFERARACFGPISILVNNAGQAKSAPFAKTDEVLWQDMLTVNLGGVFLCTKAALGDMLTAKWGRIVNVASTAGLAGYSYVTAYCAAKHGVVGLTRALAQELATKGVTVNAVCPGYTETDIVKDAVANIVAKTGRTEEQARAELAAGNPQKRLVQPAEVANAVLWLCLPGSEAMNGQALAVAGGEIMN